jgi:putative transposase
MAIEKEIVDRLLANYEKPEDLTGENGVLRQLTKALMERALEAEMATHLGYEKHDQEAKPSGNRRNGKSKKTLKGDFGEIEIATPRDREATFEPRIIAKGQTRMAGLDAKILSMYARGMTTRDIQGHLEEIYGVTVSPTFISNVTDAVLDEVRVWQNRPLDAVYPIVYLDALVVKMREEGTVQNRAVYVAIGITMEGHKEVLGLWSSANDGTG